MNMQEAGDEAAGNDGRSRPWTGEAAVFVEPHRAVSRRFKRGIKVAPGGGGGFAATRGI
jgi:hypothetical protein